MAENISAKIIDIEIIRGNDISFFFNNFQISPFNALFLLKPPRFRGSVIIFSHRCVTVCSLNKLLLFSAV